MTDVKKVWRLLCWCCLLLVGFVGCQSRSVDPESGLQVFCAASLGNAVEKTTHELGLPAVINRGGSNTLVRQVVLGARADLLLLADDTLAREELVPKGYSLEALASNELVVIALSGQRSLSQDGGLERLLNSAPQLAIADPKTAPLGGYTEEALRTYQLTVKRVPLQDAQAVLSSVALGHAALGIVYRSDALAEKDVQVLASIPQEQHRPVLYVAALPPKASPQSRALVDSLRSGVGKNVLAEHGFLPPPPQR